MDPILTITNLEAVFGEKGIICDFSLEVNPNETHVIMGPNGCGKSTLSKVLAGHPSYTVTKGEITLRGKDLLSMSPEVRSHEGLFLAFQYPLEIPGVTTFDFLRLASNERARYQKVEEQDPLDFMISVNNLLDKLKMKKEFLNRDLNEGFSGGEKKRNEVLQMLVLTPSLVILDELDSGLDVDALKIVCENIKNNLPPGCAFIIITHYAKILTYLEPTFVHIMIDGKIKETGHMELVEKVEREGYEAFEVLSL
jgi:Fe-S cluster assembly ATP-binding protein